MSPGLVLFCMEVQSLLPLLYPRLALFFRLLPLLSTDPATAPAPRATLPAALPAALAAPLAALPVALAAPLAALPVAVAASLAARRPAVAVSEAALEACLPADLAALEALPLFLFGAISLTGVVLQHVLSFTCQFEACRFEYIRAEKKYI